MFNFLRRFFAPRAPYPLPPSIEKENREILEQQTVVLTPNTPMDVLGLTLTLRVFNHKFQRDPGDQHEWVEVDVFKDGIPFEAGEFSLMVSQSVDEHGVKKEFRAKTNTFTDYQFEIVEIKYNASAEIAVYRLK
jgi:hypothetical protein